MSSERAARFAAGIALPVRIYLGVIFIAAGAAKIADPYDFALSVATYQLLPLAWINLLAITLPWVEVCSGLLLVVGLRTKESSILIVAMMLVFTVVLIEALRQGLQIDCGCFASGETADEISWRTLIRDLGWTAMAAFVLIADDGRFGLDRFLRR